METRTSLERRVEMLEEEVAKLKAALSAKGTAKDWRTTVGMFAEDHDFDEVLKLGEEHRRRDRLV